MHGHTDTRTPSVSGWVSHQSDANLPVTGDSQAGDCFLGLGLTMTQFRRRGRGSRVSIAGACNCFLLCMTVLPLHRPEWFSKEVANCFPLWLETVGNVADVLIGSLKDVLNDLRKRFEQYPPTRYAPLRLGHFHLGADIHHGNRRLGLSPNLDSVIERLKARVSFLMVGTVDSRKGHIQALAAFEQLWSRGTEANLVVVGKPGWHQQHLAQSMLQHPEAGERLIWLQEIGDEYLERIYGSCTCLLAASEGEGFGLPLIEAAQKGLPILPGIFPFLGDCWHARILFSGNRWTGAC